MIIQTPEVKAGISCAGDKVAVTDSEGHFELSNVTSGKYEVVAKLKGYYFSTETLEISPNNPALPGN